MARINIIRIKNNKLAIAIITKIRINSVGVGFIVGKNKFELDVVNSFDESS
jgi:hypothetical protein